MALQQIIGRNLTIALYDKRMTNAQLAKSVGVSEATISYAATGRKIPSLHLLMKIADELGTTVIDLLTNQEVKDCEEVRRNA